MAYGSIWNTTRPAGSVAAKNIDDEIRLLRAQLDERLEDVLVEDMAADPLVLKESVKGLKNDITRIVPYSDFLGDYNKKENGIGFAGDAYIDAFVGNGRYVAGLGAYVPVGCTVTKIEWMVNKTDATSLNCQFARRAFAAGAGAVALINNTVVSTSGIVVVSTPTLNTTIAADQYYYLVVTGAGLSTASYKIFAARITFNRPSIQEAT